MENAIRIGKIGPIFSSIVLGFSLGLVGGIESLEAGTRELIKNGQFEKGNLARWDVRTDDPPDSTFLADDVGSTTPINMKASASNPKGGARYAVSNQSHRSYQIMSQKFRIPRNTRRVVVQFQMFVHSFGPVVKNTNFFSLDADPNQQARVDILKGSAGIMNTGGGVVKQLYRAGADAVNSSTPPAFKRYRTNVTRKVKPGRYYRIRYAVAAREDVINMGVDNVSVKAR